MSALLAGTIAVPAFAPLGWFPFSILSLAALFLLWDRDGASTGFWTGFAIDILNALRGRVSLPRSVTA